MVESSEEDLIRQAEELEKDAASGKNREGQEKKAQALAQAVLHHLEQHRENPAAQRASLVRLAKAKPISRLLRESGLIEITDDTKLGRTVIALRADDELVERMHRANTGQIIDSPETPLIRVFRRS